jgi:hypothetical protein
MPDSCHGIEQPKLQIVRSVSLGSGKPKGSWRAAWARAYGAGTPESWGSRREEELHRRESEADVMDQDHIPHGVVVFYCSVCAIECFKVEEVLRWRRHSGHCCFRTSTSSATAAAVSQVRLFVLCWLDCHRCCCCCCYVLALGHHRSTLEQAQPSFIIGCCSAAVLWLFSVCCRRKKTTQSVQKKTNHFTH